ncbi:MAG: right-handed parallel beta-helix repeat-containing protein [Anaerolineales bacterium]|nr:right-handed parallel beta-helix repeat-containing protein [Anaerolineales bacterium]
MQAVSLSPRLVAALLAGLLLLVGVTRLLANGQALANKPAPAAGPLPAPAAQPLTRPEPKGADTARPMLAAPITPTNRLTGSVTLLAGPYTCASSTVAGQVCYDVQVDCAQTFTQAAPLGATLKVAAPLATPTRGTILFFSGWTGDYDWDESLPGRLDLIAQLRGAGYRTVQIAWASSWWDADPNELVGVGRLACRPASLIDWIYAAPALHNGLQEPEEAYCATGHSSGAAQLAFSMAQYGVAGHLATAVFEAGPNWSRVDHACLQSADPLYAPLYEAFGGRRVIDRAFGFGGANGICTNSDPAERARFEEASLTYNNWLFSYPTTAVSFLFGTLDTSLTRQQGIVYHDRVLQAASPHVVSTTLTGAGHYVSGVVAGANLMRDTFLDSCQPSTYYVVESGAGCGGSTPCVTGAAGLQQALDALPVAGGTIVVSGTLAITANAPVRVRDGRSVTLRGLNGGTLTSAAGACSGPLLQLENGAAAVTVENLTLDGSSGCGSGQRDGIAVTAASAGPVTLQNLTIQNAATGIDEQSSAAVTIGGAPGSGSTFSNNGTAIASDGGATIKDNTVSGGGAGIRLSANALAVYANSVTGTSGQAVDCTGSATTGAAFNYLGGSPTGAGSSCTDARAQLGAPIVAWTDAASLHEASSTTGPIFDLGSAAPFGYAGLGVDSNYYAVAAGSVTIAGSGPTQFKMLMGGSGCSPMTSACWESIAHGRPQQGPGYFYNGSLDPTAVSLRALTANRHENQAAVLLLAITLLGSLLLLYVKGNYLSGTPRNAKKRQE